MKLSEKIIELRKAFGMTQEDLASICNVSRQSISKWEADIALPETEKLLLLGEIFHVSIIDFLNVHKIELWNSGGKPKYWTVLFFTSDKKDFPEQISKVMVSDPDNGGNWFVDFKAGNKKYIVFKDKILKYQIGNQTEKDYVCSECRKMGILDEQMHWSE